MQVSFLPLLAQQSAPASPDGSLLDKIQPSDVLILAFLVLAAIVLISIPAIISLTISRRRDAEIELKRDMVERGMSADEIERILAAKVGGK